ncbi:hypothetical protein V7S43_004637 [Phytophthora oleae]|uniref:Uncharacterized protein n=1 Tax=Phytophthora oleae TaxID=2107226 RepID=A0ABD3FV54_9STRA
MQLYRQVIALVVVLSQASAANVTWSPCPIITSYSEEVLGEKNQKAECVMYTPSLCHPSICETPASANATIDVFVKRIPAKKDGAESAPNAWLLQGGPGYTPMDAAMLVLYVNLCHVLRENTV